MTKRATDRLGGILASGLSVAALLLGSPALASTIRIHVDDEAARAALAVLADRTPAAKDVRAVVKSRGYEMMALQIERAEGLPAGKGAPRIADALTSAARKRAKAGLGFERAMGGTSAYQAALRDLRRDAGRLEFEAARRLGQMLPPGSDFESTLRIVVGGTATGMAFSSGTDVVLRIDDFVIPNRSPSSLDSQLDYDALAATAIHELYHVGFVAAGGVTPRLTHPDEEWLKLASMYGPEVIGEVWRGAREKRWNSALMQLRMEAWVQPTHWNTSGVDRFLHHLSRMQNEGCAVYAEAPAGEATSDERRRAEIDLWMKTIRSDFGLLAQMADAMDHGADAAQIDRIAADAFRDNGPFYRVGHRMAERIDTRSGRRALHAATTGGPLEFVERYLETHPDGPNELDADTERVLRQLIREVRAVGAFDPLD